MFEKEKKQYEEDSKNYERPWELWQWAPIDNNPDCEDWKQLKHAPSWWHKSKYRRKLTTFNPEYYSGLNWIDAEQLIGKTVECTNNPDSGWYVGTLKQFSKNDVIARFGVLSEGDFDFVVYIRTCEETFKHPTINIGGVELPMPETKELEVDGNFWIFYPFKSANLYHRHLWMGIDTDRQLLSNGLVHLTEERAKAWADWWKSMVIDKLK